MRVHILTVMRCPRFRISNANVNKLRSWSEKTYKFACGYTKEQTNTTKSREFEHPHSPIVIEPRHLKRNEFGYKFYILLQVWLVWQGPMLQSEYDETVSHLAMALQCYGVRRWCNWIKFRSHTHSQTRIRSTRGGYDISYWKMPWNCGFMFAFSIRRTVNPVTFHSVLHPQSPKNVGHKQSERKIADRQKCKPFIYAMQFGLLFAVLSIRYEASHQHSEIEHLYSNEKIWFRFQE